MKTKLFFLLSTVLVFKPVFAACDLTEFKWGCDFRARSAQTSATSSVVYCANIPVYLNTAQYDMLRAYQRANVNMVLKVNGEYVTGPCMLGPRR